MNAMEKRAIAVRKFSEHPNVAGYTQHRDVTRTEEGKLVPSKYIDTVLIVKDNTDDKVQEQLKQKLDEIYADSDVTYRVSVVKESDYEQTEDSGS